MLKSCYRWLAPLALVAVLATVATACPTCKEGLDASDPLHQSAARGFFYSILFMMSMPFAILGTFGSIAYFSIRRAKANGAGDGGPANTVDQDPTSAG